jgi:hypothetical protein
VENQHDATCPPRREALELFLDRMTRQECMLVALCRELYDGSWDAVEADLRSRLEGRPYVFKLATRIVDDLDRVERLRLFEADHGVRLSDYITLDS